MRHPFHALCPYFAMFPEAFAAKWIGRLSRPGDLVLDPFSGRGTTPFQALLMGRRAVACDINPVAYCVSRAKSCPPTSRAVDRRLDQLEVGYRAADWDAEADALAEFFQVAYHPATLRQVVYLRSTLRWKQSRVDNFLAAVALRCLHGESHKSAAYLSNRMPRTISTKPAYSVRYWRERGLLPPERNAFDILRQQVAFRFREPTPGGEAAIYHCDMRRLPGRLTGCGDRARLVITSPPYFDVTSFEEDQWLRLWFLGGGSRPVKRAISPDDRHESEPRYWRFLADLWRTLAAVTGRRADVVVRLGASRLTPAQLVRGLTAAADGCGRPVRLVSRRVSAIKGRQTASFRPGSNGCRVEVDCHLAFAD